MHAEQTGPLRFVPLHQERVWGGRRLAELFGRELAEGRPIGESWELVDRPEAQSVVAGGPLAGVTLGELWRGRRDLFGTRATGVRGRFPLLIKLLDARDVLSVQVHPPVALASLLGGEPKTETWIVLDAAPGAYLLVGLREGATRAQLERCLRAGGDVADLLHRVDVRGGDAILIPSGRVHAIGPGNVILEIQQNSDTTYRVFDFNRPGLDGRPRDLHVDESLASIDFTDFTPELAPVDDDGTAISSAYFQLDRWTLTSPRPAAAPGEMAVVCVVSGSATLGGVELGPGDLALVPATSDPPTVGPAGGGKVAVVRAMLPGPSEPRPAEPGAPSQARRRA
ncbi:MAG TPA: type I phosphomannose isomerase catalytic subunit [Solirubrobacteraceae bacterium]|nr:type I phosphomannose isomerase catalytic subunit [Solirubrobacteraceae bacterium]